MHHTHTTKANRPEFRRGQGWLCGKLDVVRYRTCLLAARFLHRRVVRAVRVELERPDGGCKPRVQRRLICTDPGLSAQVAISGYAKRWTVESLFCNLKDGFGLKDAWQPSRHDDPVKRYRMLRR